MATASKKLKFKTSAKTRNLHKGTTPIANFDELIIALKSDQRFEKYEIDYPKPNIASLSVGKSTLFMVGYEIWSNPENLEPFIVDRKISHEHSMVCCGSESELEKLPKLLNVSHSHMMAFPSPLTNLHFLVKDLIRNRGYQQLATLDKQEATETLENVKHVLSISRELNQVRDVDRLLELILEKAIAVTKCDAGSIYVVEPGNDEKDPSLVFKICKNSSVPLNLSEFKMPITDQSIVGNSVLHTATIDIPDLYKLDKDASKNPYNARHDVSWDEKNNYETHSMLSIPIFDIGHDVIGVIQLINRKNGDEPLTSKSDFEKRVTPFAETDIEYGEIVAHQSGIALENAMLTEEKEKLFEGFVDASVKAIEQRDPTTSGHSHRVARLTLDMADIINRIPNGPYGSVSFNESQLKEIEYASLLHDFGKLGVREQVLLKAKKLYGWQLDLLEERFELIRARYEVEHLNDVIKYLKAPNIVSSNLSLNHFESEHKSKIQELDQYLDTIKKSNEPSVLEQGNFELLKDIANRHFNDSRTKSRPFLLADELKALSISRGSLTSEEFSEIQSHVTHTYEFLRKIPWGKELSNVPNIAAKHHEKLDGSGYPNSAAAVEIPPQSRIMTISDIFDALTASDRPYKKAVPVSRALDIIEMEVKSGKCDPDLFKIFVESKCYENVL